MGYTISWGTNPALRTRLAVSRNVPVLDTPTLLLLRRIFDDHVEHVRNVHLEPDCISFQSGPDMDQGGEIFDWRQHSYGIGGNSCGTARHPYQHVICLVMLVLRRFYAGCFVFTSNDDAESHEWQQVLIDAGTRYDISIDTSTLACYLREEADVLRWF